MDYKFEELKIGDIVLLHIAEVNPKLKSNWYLYLGMHDITKCLVFLDGECQVRVDGYLLLSTTHPEIIKDVK